MPIGNIINVVASTLAFFIISFIIWFPIFAWYYMRKIKKIRKNIPKELLEKLEKERLDKLSKGGDVNGKDIGEEETNFGSSRDTDKGIGGGGRGTGGEDIEPRGDTTTDNISEGFRGISPPEIEPRNQEERADEGTERDSKEDWPSFE